MDYLISFEKTDGSTVEIVEILGNNIAYKLIDDQGNGKNTTRLMRGVSGLPELPEGAGWRWDEQSLTLHYITEGTEGEEDQVSESLLNEAFFIALFDNPPALPIDMDKARRRLWESFNQWAESETDANSRTSINLITVNPQATPQQLERAQEWANWWQALWGVYAAKRESLVSTGTYPQTDFEQEVGHAPWNIWEIAE